MTNKERLELNKAQLTEEYKNLNSLLFTGKGYDFEISSRMTDISSILMNKYGFSASDIEALEA